MKITVSVAGAATASSSAVRCSAEFEAEAIDPATLDRIVQTVQQCEAAVHRTQGPPPRAQGHAPEPSGSPPARPDSRSAAAKRLATEKQVKAIQAMARRQGIELGYVLHDRFGVSRVSELSISEASMVIDELKKPAADYVGSG